MWDCNGLEAAVNVTSIEQQRVWAALKGQDTTKVQMSPNLMHWQLRAQFNPQRFYEIYLITVEDDVTVEDIRSAFESAPQAMADRIREIGHCFFSNRNREEVKIV